MIIGAQLYTVREQCQTPEDMKRTLTAVRKIGYTCVQLSGHNLAIPFADIAGWCGDLGLSVGSTHTSYQRMLEDLPGVIADHKMLGCPYPGIGGMPGKYSASAEGFAAFAAEVAPVAKKMRDEGLTFVYHNHNHEFIRFATSTGSESGMDILLRHAVPEMQFELDTHWVQAGGASPVAWIEKVKGRCDVVHFKDMVYDANEHRGVICEVGSGNLDWPGIFGACKASGVKYAFVEQDDEHPKRPRLESLAMSYAFLKDSGL